MSKKPSILPYQSDCYAEIYNVVDGVTAAPVNGAAVTVSLFARDDTPIANASNLPAAYDAVTNVYRATIPSNAGVTEGQSVRCEAILVFGGLTSRIWLDAIVRRYPGA